MSFLHAHKHFASPVASSLVHACMQIITQNTATNNSATAAWSCFLQGDDWGGRGALVRNIHIAIFIACVRLENIPALIDGIIHLVIRSNQPLLHVNWRGKTARREHHESGLIFCVCTTRRGICAPKSLFLIMRRACMPPPSWKAAVTSNRTVRVGAAIACVLLAAQ